MEYWGGEIVAGRGGARWNTFAPDHTIGFQSATELGIRVESHGLPRARGHRAGGGAWRGIKRSAKSVQWCRETRPKV
jgi:hypothetical protein